MFQVSAFFSVDNSNTTGEGQLVNGRVVGKQIRTKTLFFIALLVTSLKKTVKMTEWDAKNSEMCRKTKVTNTKTETDD